MERAAPACAEECARLAAAPLRLALQGIGNGSGADVLAPGRGDRARAVLAASDWSAQLLVSADRGAVFAIVETMLGGDGSQPAHAAERPLSKIEAALAGVFFARFARALAAAFAPVAPAPSSVEATAEAIDFDRIERDTPWSLPATARGPGARRRGAGRHPARGARRHAQDPVAGRPPRPRRSPIPAGRSRSSKEVTRAHVTLTAILDERPGLLGEVLNLEVGQVLELKATPQSRVRVECNGERLMWCDFGKSNGVYTLRVDDFVDREQEFMDDILAA